MWAAPNDTCENCKHWVFKEKINPDFGLCLRMNLKDQSMVAMSSSNANLQTSHDFGCKLFEETKGDELDF